MRRSLLLTRSVACTCLPRPILAQFIEEPKPLMVVDSKGNIVYATRQLAMM